jgi:Protein of unknown function (DUF1488)
MSLTNGTFHAYDPDRMVVLFTMMNGATEVACAISTVAMDDLDGPCKGSSMQREAQFLRLRDRIEGRAAEKFEEHRRGSIRSEVVLRSNDF